MKAPAKIATTGQAKAPAKVAAKVPAKAAVKAPVKAPAKAPAKAARQAPVKAPGKVAAKVAAKVPTKSPTKAPTKAPAKVAAKAPAKAPARVPAKTAVKAPAKAPARTPVRTAPEKQVGTRVGGASRVPVRGRGGATGTAPTSQRPASMTTSSTATRSRPAPAKAARPRPSSTRKDTWTAGERQAIRVELEREVAELTHEIDEASNAYDRVLRDGGEGAGDDQADAGSATFEREHEMSLAANSRELLAQAQRALQRLDAGSYGVCEMCGSPIGKARLQAFPKVTLCMACKQREMRR